MTVALLLFGVMLALAILGLPLAISILIASVVTLLYARPEMPMELVPQLFVSGIDNFPLLAIAFFFLAGELMNAGGITQRILRFANAFVGHLRGGLAQVGVITSMIFAGVSGSAVADAAAVGSVLIPSMKKSGYPAAFSAAVIETASVMGPIIPPSIPMIIYAVLAEVSVGGMFLAGIIPGLMVAAFLALLIYVISLRAGFPRQPRAAFGERVSASADAILALLSPVIIVGGILGGVFTATEAGAVAALYVFLIGALVYRELTLRQIAAVLVRSAKGTATVLVILGASSLFAWIIADQQISRKAAAFVTEAGAPDWIVLVGINLFFFLMGMFLDPLAALIILVPIFLPIGVGLGMDPIHFGVMTVINLMIGLCTPPVGYLIYMTADIAGESPWKVIVQSLPFLAALVAVLALTVAFPAITLFLPRMFLG